MTIRNVSASIRQRLFDLARAQGSDYQRVLTRYAIERLLFRLSQTDARRTYVLKGAMLFATWPAHAFRPTGDLDLLGQGDPTPDAIAALFTEICQIPVAADGIVFEPATLRIEPVREEGKYQGAQLALTAELARARIPFQVDIGFGDLVYPEPQPRIFPVLLRDLPAAEMLMYPPETVVAEKFEAMVRFGEANTRLKDFHDIWVVTRIFSFDMSVLVEAIGGTLRRRETPLPTAMPVALTERFAEVAGGRGLWTGFLRRTPPTLQPPAFDDLLVELRRFFGPVLAALTLPESAVGGWNPDRGAWE